MQRAALVGLVLLGAAGSAAGQPPDTTERPVKANSYSAVGWASWYGHEFHGRRTADGEMFDMGGLTAAHKSMPLPCYARVTNLRNGRSMVVRVNDRGPFVADRVIDVSARVANLLDFQRSGLTKVKVEYVGMAPLGGADGPALLASLKTRDSPDDGVSAFTPTRPVVAAIAPARPAVAAFAPAPTVVAAYAPTPAASGVFSESDALVAANRIANNGPARTVSLDSPPPSPRGVSPPSPYGALVPSPYGDLTPWPADPAAPPSLIAELRR
ncbi:MAG: septal ring lytic transglycosylase RlpA family protein [Roseiarcus sp.]|jgi:rare lipoprotein A